MCYPTRNYDCLDRDDPESLVAEIERLDARIRELEDGDESQEE